MLCSITGPGPINTNTSSRKALMDRLLVEGTITAYDIEAGWFKSDLPELAVRERMTEIITEDALQIVTLPDEQWRRRALY